MRESHWARGSIVRLQIITLPMQPVCPARHPNPLSLRNMTNYITLVSAVYLQMIGWMADDHLNVALQFHRMTAIQMGVWRTFCTVAALIVILCFPWHFPITYHSLCAFQLCTTYLCEHSPQLHSIPSVNTWSDRCLLLSSPPCGSSLVSGIKI